jgi:hypothetical protein
MGMDKTSGNFYCNLDELFAAASPGIQRGARIIEQKVMRRNPLPYTVRMRCLFAFAEAPDNSNTGAVLVLATLGILVAAAVLTSLPIVFARSRRHRHVEIIAALAVLWGFLAAGSIVKTSIDQANWSKERLVRIQSGYYNPNESDGSAPVKPLKTWAGLTGAYAMLMVWSLASRPRHP